MKISAKICFIFCLVCAGQGAARVQFGTICGNPNTAMSGVDEQAGKVNCDPGGEAENRQTAYGNFGQPEDIPLANVYVR